MAVVEPEHLDEFMAITDRWDVEATVVGEVTDGRPAGHHLARRGRSSTSPPRSVAHDGPAYDRPLRAARIPGRAAGRTEPHGLARPATGERAARDAAAAARLARTSATSPGSPTSTTATSWATPRWRMPDDAGVVRVDEETGRGVAVSTDCNGRFAKLDPYAGAQLALAEAYRNVATAGAAPLAVTDCLNFGSPEDPGVMWQFARGRPRARRRLPGRSASRSPAATCRFYNQTGDVAIHPTPGRSACSASWTTSPAARPSGWQDAGPGDLPARHDPRRARRLRVGARRARAPRRPAAGGRPRPPSSGWPRSWSTPRRDGLVDAAHDLSDGGLAHRARRGAAAPRRRRPDLARRGVRARRRSTRSPRCSASRPRRAVVAVPRSRGGAVHRHVRGPRLRRTPASASSTRSATALDVQGQFTLPLADLRAAHTATLPAAFGH